jgi:ribosomal protein S13
MKKLSEELVDESYKSIKSFTKNNQLTEEELSAIDLFVKDIQKIMNNLEEKKDKNLTKSLGEIFKNLIENGIKDGKRNT